MAPDEKWMIPFFKGLLETKTIIIPHHTLRDTYQLEVHNTMAPPSSEIFPSPGIGRAEKTYLATLKKDYTTPIDPAVPSPLAAEPNDHVYNNVLSTEKKSKNGYYGHIQWYLKICSKTPYNVIKVTNRKAC